VSRSSLYPEPPHVSAAFFFDSGTHASAFNGVCKHAIDVGATPTGELEIVRAAAFPYFAMISDLAPELECVRLDLRKGSVLDQWKQWRDTHDPSGHVLRAGFDTPQVGRVVVEFEPIPERFCMDIPHPVAVTIGGELLSMPAHVSLDKRERAQAAKAARFLLAVFRSVCESSLNPLYGSIVAEGNLPTPPELRASKKARVGQELFVSTRLGVADPGLERDLATIFAGAFVERWATGLFFSGWAPFNPEGRTVASPLEVGTHAAHRLGQALRH
jgi:hypothetical protein